MNNPLLDLIDSDAHLQGLWASILHDPSCTTARLIFADRLEELQWDEEAAFIRANTGLVATRCGSEIPRRLAIHLPLTRKPRSLSMRLLYQGGLPCKLERVGDEITAFYKDTLATLARLPVRFMSLATFDIRPLYRDTNYRYVYMEFNFDGTSDIRFPLIHANTLPDIVSIDIAYRIRDYFFEQVLGLTGQPYIDQEGKKSQAAAIRLAHESPYFAESVKQFRQCIMTNKVQEES